MTYRILNADLIERTLETLLRRIEERFPKRGLAKLCAKTRRENSPSVSESTCGVSDIFSGGPLVCKLEDRPQFGRRTS